MRIERKSQKNWMENDLTREKILKMDENWIKLEKIFFKKVDN